jgi:hypothetical protein
VNLFETENNPLVDFLISFNSKKRVRRKYVEYKLMDYSITQGYKDDVIHLRKHIGLSKKEMYSNFKYIQGSRAYKTLNSDINSVNILIFLTEYLNKENKLRKLKIKKLIK